MKKQKLEVGDLVQLKGIWKNRVGIIKALDDEWYMIADHIDACHCIVDIIDVKLIKKHVVPKKYIKYIE